MFLGHIGEHAIEAIYEVRAGDNFGWSEREGAFVFDKAATEPLRPAASRCPPTTTGTATRTRSPRTTTTPPPGWNCTADVGVAVAGGFVYRGRTLPALRGKYVFGDLVDGRVLYTEANEMRRGRDAGHDPPARRSSTRPAQPVRMRDLSAPGRAR